MRIAPAESKTLPGLVWSLALISGLLSLSGCAASTSFKDPAYSGQEFQTDAVGFMPIRYTEIGMEAFEEFRKAFKKETDNGGEIKLAEAFNKTFINSVKGRLKNFRVLDSGPVVDPNQQYETKQLLNKGKKSQSAMRVYIPMKSAVDSLQPPVRFVVTARNFNFSYKVEESAGYMTPGNTISTPGGKITTGGTMMGGGKSKVITVSMTYMVWDYQKDAPVSYGKYSTDMSAKIFFTQGEWLGMMNQAATRLSQALP